MQRRAHFIYFIENQKHEEEHVLIQLHAAKGYIAALPRVDNYLKEYVSCNGNVEGLGKDEGHIRKCSLGHAKKNFWFSDNWSKKYG